MIQMNLFTKQKQTHRHRKQIYGYQRGKGGERRIIKKEKNLRLAEFKKLPKVMELHIV